MPVRRTRRTFSKLVKERHKDEEAVLCVNRHISCPVTQSTRRTGVFYRILSRRRQLSVQRVAPRNRRSQFPIESKGN
jgi:hypothetical protein